MAYINVGAKSDIYDVRSKAALKQLVKDNDRGLTFYGTSDFSPFNGGIADIPEGVKLTVTGPNPYTDRKWYATVTKTGGKITVK